MAYLVTNVIPMQIIPAPPADLSRGRKDGRASHIPALSSETPRRRSCRHRGHDKAPLGLCSRFPNVAKTTTGVSRRDPIPFRVGFPHASCRRRCARFIVSREHHTLPPCPPPRPRPPPLQPWVRPRQRPPEGPLVSRPVQSPLGPRPMPRPQSQPGCGVRRLLLMVLVLAVDCENWRCGGQRRPSELTLPGPTVHSTQLE